MNDTRPSEALLAQADGSPRAPSDDQLGRALARIYLKVLSYGQPNTQPIAHPINTADETAPQVRPADDIEAQDE